MRGLTVINTVCDLFVKFLEHVTTAVKIYTVLQRTCFQMWRPDSNYYTLAFVVYFRQARLRSLNASFLLDWLLVVVDRWVRNIIYKLNMFWKLACFLNGHVPMTSETETNLFVQSNNLSIISLLPILFSSFI